MTEAERKAARAKLMERLTNVNALPKDVEERVRYLHGLADEDLMRFFEPYTDPRSGVTYPFNPNLLYTKERIAPLNDIQEKLLERARRQNANRQNTQLNSVGQQLSSAMGINPSAQSWNYFDKSRRNPLAQDIYTQRMNSEHLGNLQNIIREQGRKIMEEDILPHIQHYGYSGEANNIGLRERQKQRMLERHAQSMEREMRKLAAEHEEKAYQAAERGLEREYSAGLGIANAASAAQQGAATVGQAIGNNERLNEALGATHRAELAGLGAMEQEHKQRQLQADQEKHWEMENARINELQKHINATAGTPQFQPSTTTTATYSPAQSMNPWQGAANIMGSLMSTAGHAYGGHVKKRAAGGATEGYAASPHHYGDQELSYMNSPEMQHLIAEQQRLSQPDPDAHRNEMAERFIRWGSDNSGASPMQAWGNAYLEARENAQKTANSQRDRSHAIAEAIQRSRVDQVKMMHLYEHNRHEHLRKLSKDQRDNARAMSKEAREMEEHAWKRAEKGSGYGGYGGGFGGGMRKKLSPEDRKRLEEARENMKSLEGLIPDLEIIHKTSDPEGEHYVETGGFYENHLPEWLQSQWWRAQLGKGEQRDIADQDRAMKSLPIKMAEQAQRGRLGIGTIRAMQEAKMRNSDEPGSVHESSGNTLQKVRRDYKKEELVWKAHQKYDMTPSDAEGLWDDYEQAVESYPDLTVSQFLDLVHGVSPEGLERAESESAPPSPAPRKKRGEPSIQELNEKYANDSLDKLEEMLRG